MTFVQREMLQKLGFFDGITVNEAKGENGDYTVKMSEDEWKVFQANQAKFGCVSCAAPKTCMKFTSAMDASRLLKRDIREAYICSQGNTTLFGCLLDLYLQTRTPSVSEKPFKKSQSRWQKHF